MNSEAFRTLERLRDAARGIPFAVIDDQSEAVRMPMANGSKSRMRDAEPRGASPAVKNTSAQGASMCCTEGSIGEWIDRVRAEYREMPGLSLTIQQAARLLGLEPSACRALFDVLHTSGFLRRTASGEYVRPNRV
jgi:hypothetical protein